MRRKKDRPLPWSYLHRSPEACLIGKQGRLEKGKKTNNPLELDRRAAGYLAEKSTKGDK